MSTTKEKLQTWQRRNKQWENQSSWELVIEEKIERERKTERERKSDMRRKGCHEGCWVKHVEIRAVQRALKNLAGQRLNS